MSWYGYIGTKDRKHLYSVSRMDVDQFEKIKKLYRKLDDLYQEDEFDDAFSLIYSSIEQFIKATTFFEILKFLTSIKFIVENFEMIISVGFTTYKFLRETLIYEDENIEFFSEMEFDKIKDQFKNAITDEDLEIENCSSGEKPWNNEEEVDRESVLNALNEDNND